MVILQNEGYHGNGRYYRLFLLPMFPSCSIHPMHLGKDKLDLPLPTLSHPLLHIIKGIHRQVHLWPPLLSLVCFIIHSALILADHSLAQWLFAPHTRKPLGANAEFIEHSTDLSAVHNLEPFSVSPTTPPASLSLFQHMHVHTRTCTHSHASLPPQGSPISRDGFPHTAK